MSTITFDTLKFVKTLKQAGFNESQAEALAQAQSEAIESSTDMRLATKQDIVTVKEEIQKTNDKLTGLASDMKTIQILLGLLVVAVLVPNLKGWFN